MQTKCDLNPPRRSRDSGHKPRPRFSIIMPSFNQAAFIERSILSVLNQGYPDLEFIIIDGGSTDGTIEIIKKYETYLAHWVSEPDAGQSDALNKGFARATGDIYGWLNSDDLFLPDAFEIAEKAFRLSPSKKIVFGDWLSVGPDDNLLDLNHAFDFSVEHFKYEGFHLNAQAMFWRSDVHRAFGGFEVSLHRTMDYQMIMEFALQHGDEAFLRIPLPLAAFRRYEGQKTQGLDKQVLDEHIWISEQYGYSDKYASAGKLKRLRFRVRRTFWYWKRGGFGLLSKRLIFAYGRNCRRMVGA